MKHVYFMRARETGHIKIGISDDPERRRAVLERAMPLHLDLLASIPVISVTRRRDAQLVETGLHHRFSHARHKGEWFRPTPDLLAYIGEVTTFSRWKLSERNPRPVGANFGSITRLRAVIEAEEAADPAQAEQAA